MGIKIIYEQTIFRSGWYDGSSGLTPQSWWDHDLTSDIDDGSGGGGGGVIPILKLEPPFLDDPDEIFVLPPITYEITTSFFVNKNIIFVPMSIRALGAPDQMLRNEVRRRR
jgi:hypothetical protein